MKNEWKQPELATLDVKVTAHSPAGGTCEDGSYTEYATGNKIPTYRPSGQDTDSGEVEVDVK